VWPQLRALPGFESRRIEPARMFAAAGVDAQALSELYARLSQPAARANLVRAAILAAEGGVYLDMDTVHGGNRWRSCAAAGAFCGLERIAFSGGRWCRVARAAPSLPRMRLTTLRENLALVAGRLSALSACRAMVSGAPTTRCWQPRPATRS